MVEVSIRVVASVVQAALETARAVADEV